jgi:putative spermidine/putrescine transport system substrate-binding protein
MMPLSRLFPLLFALPVMATAQTPALVVANFGGANGKAQEVAFLKPFARESKTPVQGAEYDGDLGALRKMVQSRKVAWDVVEVESSELTIGCKEGLFEPFDKAQVKNASMLMPGSVQACGVGAFVWSTVLAYNSAALKTAPRSWADFWDVQKFPGQRGMRKGARYNLEFALMADGVHRRDVYALLATEAGLQRALNKLQQLKPHIVWWESGAQPPKMLASGEWVMSTAYNGRISAAVADGASGLSIAWNDAIYDLDFWAIVKGSTRADLARAFVNFATTDPAQLAFSREITYGPTNYNAILSYDNGRKRAPDDRHLVDLSMAPSDLPSAPGNLRRSLAFNPGYWVANGAQIEKQLADLLK